MARELSDRVDVFIPNEVLDAVSGVGDIYFVSTNRTRNYHIGAPDSKVRGVLYSGRGRILVYLLWHLNEFVTEEELRNCSGVKNIPVAITGLKNQMFSSSRFRVVLPRATNGQHTYKLQG